MRFLVDMPLSPALAEWLNAQGHDAIHASTSDLSRAPDSEILSRAIAEGRVVVTADLDFPRLLAAVRETGPGLILLRGGNYSDAEARECVRRVLVIIDESELSRSLIVVDKHRIRKRILPLN